jgi:hypothetical protein
MLEKSAAPRKTGPGAGEGVMAAANFKEEGSTYEEQGDLLISAENS